MEPRLYGLTPTDVRRIVYKYCVKNDIQSNFNKDKEMAGRYWFEGFLRRNPELSVRQAESVSIQRAIGFNKPKVDTFYAVLKQKLFNDSGDKVIPPGNIYSVDESGYTVCQKPNKIIAKKGRLEKFGLDWIIKFTKAMVKFARAIQLLLALFKISSNTMVNMVVLGV